MRTPLPEMTCSFLIQLVFCLNNNNYTVNILLPPGELISFGDDGAINSL